MNQNKRNLAAILALILVAVLLVGGLNYAGVIDIGQPPIDTGQEEDTPPPAGPFEPPLLKYYGEDTADNDFGTSIGVDHPVTASFIAQGYPKSVCTLITLLRRMTPYRTDTEGADALLSAAWIIETGEFLGWEYPIPSNIAKMPYGAAKVNALHDAFVDFSAGNADLWIQCVDLFRRYVDDDNLTKVSFLSGASYQTSMYMKDSDGDGVLEVFFTTEYNSGPSVVLESNGKTVYVKTNCGGQPSRGIRTTPTNPSNPAPTTPAPDPSNPVPPIGEIDPDPSNPAPDIDDDDDGGGGGGGGGGHRPSVPAKTEAEPTPSGTGFEGKPNNQGNPPESSEPEPSDQVNPNTTPGNSTGGGQATAPGAGNLPADRDPGVTQPTLTQPSESSEAADTDLPAYSGSPGNPNDIP